MRVAAFGFVVHGLADVVQQAAAPCELTVEAELIGDHLGDVGDFQRVAQHVLAVAGAIAEPAEHWDDRLCYIWDICFLNRFLADLDQLFFHLLGRLRDQFLDAGGMNAAILHEPLQ